MHCPGADLTDHDIAIGDRTPVAGQHQLGDRFQVDDIGLDPAPSLHAALLSDLSGVEFQHFPPIGPLMVEHRSVIVAGRLHAHLDLHRGRCDSHRASRRGGQARSGHREFRRREQPMASRVGHRKHS